MERIMGVLGYVPVDIYEAEKHLRESAQARSYEFYNKYLALKAERGVEVG